METILTVFGKEHRPARQVSHSLGKLAVADRAAGVCWIKWSIAR
jgi:hypothetical protein